MTGPELCEVAVDAAISEARRSGCPPDHELIVASAAMAAARALLAELGIMVEPGQAVFVKDDKGALSTYVCGDAVRDVSAHGGCR